jgi:hypothetical protein
MTEPQQLDNLTLIQTEIRRRLGAPQKIDANDLAIMVSIEGQVREIRRDDADHKSGTPERGRRKMQAALTKALSELVPSFKADVENRATELQAKLRIASALTGLIEHVTGSISETPPPKVAGSEG